MRKSLFLVPILGLLAAAPAGAALIYGEGFNSALSTPYTVTGGGTSGGGTNYWARNAAPVVSPGFTGFEGTSYWAGRDLDDVAGATHAVELNVAGVNLAGYSGVTVSILLAANTGVWDGAPQPDAVRLYAVNAVGGALTLLDTFLSVGATDTNLRSQATGVNLGTAFVRFTYNIPISIGTLRFRFEAASTGDLEWVGFDDVRIEGTPVPEPSTAGLLALGLALLAGVGRRSVRRAGR